METLEEQRDDKWMTIRCNDSSPVQMVKVKFSCHVVRNGKDYQHAATFIIFAEVYQRTYAFSSNCRTKIEIVHLLNR